MTPQENSRRNLVDVIRQHASTRPDKVAYVALLDGETETGSLTFGELDRQARIIAASLQHKASVGDRVLLLYPAGLDFVAGFFGCLYAGMIAVPTYPPQARNISRLLSIANDCEAAVFLGTRALKESLLLLGVERLTRRPVTIFTPDLVSDAREVGEWVPSAVSEESLALLQYTSGSTAEPKGVMVSHANLLHNLAWLRQTYDHSGNTVIVSWLPVYHDMGLIGVVLSSAFVGGTTVLMAPAAFVQRPARWLEAISKYGATVCGGPNFSYEHCLRVTSKEQESLDLHTLTSLANGSEPLRAVTVKNFSTRFEGNGLRKSVLRPCYGLAEATLMVSTAPSEKAVIKRFDTKLLETNQAVEVESQEDGLALVSCGKSLADQKLLIVDPESLNPAGTGVVGEIWVAGPSVARGYWQKPELTEQVFQAYTSSGEGPFLRTGDMGFIHDGELYISGRLRDLIIINGRNHWPQDIELTVEGSHPAVEPAGVIAFSIEVEGKERLVVVCEIARSEARTADLKVMTERICNAVAREHEVEIHAVEFLNPKALPKTSSGKVQRRLCRDKFLSGALSTFAPATGIPRVVASAPTAPKRKAGMFLPKPMQFSLFYFSSNEGEYHHDKYKLLLEGARFADDHNFTAVWIPERHFHDFGGIFPNPAVLAAALATTTSKVRIRAGSVVLPLHNPIRVAEEWAAVDNLSCGRVDIAFARGWNPNDFVLAPTNFQNSTEVLYRDMETVRQLWRGESIVTPNGKGEQTRIRIYPLPQQRELPVWITCSGGIERFVEAGRGGWNILTALLFQSIDDLRSKIDAYREARLQNGHDPEAGHVTLMLHTFVELNESQVKQKVKGPLLEYLKSSADLWSQGSQKLAELSEHERNSVLDFAFERYYRTSGLFGTPESCVQRIEELKDCGVDELACLIDFGVDTKSVLKGLEALHWLKEKIRVNGTHTRQITERARTAAVNGRGPTGVDRYAHTPEQYKVKLFPEQGLAPNGNTGGRDNSDITEWLTRLIVDEIARVLEAPAETISSTQHFLNLGINSLKAIQIMSSLQERFGLKLPHSMLFEFPTISLLAAAIARQHQAEIARHVPRSPIESRPPMELQARHGMLEEAQIGKASGAKI
jgi:natural product biosynthesis luciferase-like monooxygenase protein